MPSRYYDPVRLHWHHDRSIAAAECSFPASPCRTMPGAKVSCDANPAHSHLRRARAMSAQFQYGPRTTLSAKMSSLCDPVRLHWRHARSIAEQFLDSTSSPLTQFRGITCKGVRCVPSIALISAPCSINNSIVSTLPEDVARRKGVEWVSSCAFTSAPYLSKTWAILVRDLRERSCCSLISALCWVKNGGVCYLPDYTTSDVKESVVCHSLR